MAVSANLEISANHPAQKWEEGYLPDGETLSNINENSFKFDLIQIITEGVDLG